MTIKITEINGKIAINAPYNPEYVTKIKAAGAKWDAAGKTWVIDARNIEAARGILREVYGQDDQPTELVSVRVTALELIDQKHGPVVIMGRIIGEAKSRDSGAKVGDGVCFELGKVTSGGSVKNWYTEVEKGSVIVLHDVSRAMVERVAANPPTKSSYDTAPLYSVEIIEAADPKAALRAEREALMARLAEIDKQLAE